jgi:hypothetical protein
MRKSIMVTTFLVTSAGAAGAAAALPVPYQGSDTEFHLTTDAIAAATPALTPLNAYIGGGSGNGDAAMTNNTQYTAPMSRLIKNEGKVCNFGGGNNGSTETGAEGIVLALDAVDVLSSTLAGAQTACNGVVGTGGDNTQLGLIYAGSTTGPTGDFSTAPTTANPETWKWALALVYGGKDLSNASAAVDCNSTARHNIVANWSHLFNQGCSFASGAAICNDANHGGILWHAFRRDDVSGTSDVFSSLLGLSPSTSASTLNGFGASPFCNAMNWDTGTGNANCANGAHMQWTGPGGVPDTTTDATGAHKQPPPNTWGANPDLTQGGFNADVLPTQLQDNDPIRRKCIGTTVGVTARAGEEICNIDGNLGLVLPMPDSDWMGRLATPLSQYPTNSCTGCVLGKAPNVFTCAPRGTKHSGECPNGDAVFGGGCSVPVDLANSTSSCFSDKSTVCSVQSRSLGNPDGRIYNIHMRDGTFSDNATLGYAQYNIAAISATTFTDFVGGYSRIHQVETMLPGTATQCQLVDMTDQIGCLAQADPCSIGFAGDGSKSWPARSPINTNGPVGMLALRVDQIAPAPATVQLLGLTGEYQASRKLYLSSLVGFQNIPSTTTGPSELELANFEAQGSGSTFNGIVGTDGFFTLGSTSPNGTDNQFCEDFNEDNLCNGGKGAAGALGATNTNACLGIHAGIPTIANTAFTICGDGTIGAYEECDDGANQTAKGAGKCSSTCRCTTAFVHTSTTAGGDDGCL